MERRIKISIFGAVQGVGFRPFIYRLANEMKLTGWVINSSRGVFIEAEGDNSLLTKFTERIQQEKPPNSFIQSLEFSFLDPAGYRRFDIRTSDESGGKSVLVMPDLSTCEECRKEIFDPLDRRYLYPFTNCTNCGPRFSIIEGLPYDRANTTMKKFEMCPDCRKEYNDPSDRRFHAQPNACPVCGPWLELWDKDGSLLASHNEALLRTAAAIKNGSLAAVKGIGGFHLICDAGNEKAVRELRQRKHREEKPLALMYPDLETVLKHCIVSEQEIKMINSHQSPIVLLKKKKDTPAVAESVAPDNPYLGIMLPYTPLHHLLMSELGIPVVATSGNISDEPICTDETEALNRLEGIADLFLVHNRPIARHVDDSIVRMMSGRELVLRRSRGYAPLPVHLKSRMEPVIAVGAHLKNTVAFSVGDNVFISQHIGDLETGEAYNAFRNVIRDLSGIYGLKPVKAACDMHPDYFSTKFAAGMGIKTVPVQHHFAHIVSCMAENDLDGEVLGVSWDGTGYGTDGTVWGGEFLACSRNSFERIGHLRTFGLPGGEAAIKEIWRSAAGLLYEIFGDDIFERKEITSLASVGETELKVIKQMLGRKFNTPVTSSAGRLFDAAASLLGICLHARFEGQAAMMLEFITEFANTNESYPFSVQEKDGKFIIDWEPMIIQILEERTGSQDAKAFASAKFHNTLSEAIISLARRSGMQKVVLSGGCFQNKYLTERTVERLTEEGFKPYWHQRVPPNDGGLSLGQIVAVSKEIK